MIFNLNYSAVFYGPENPAAAQQANSAMINSMRQHSQNMAGGDGGDGQQSGDEPGVGGAFDSSQVPTPWPGQLDQDKSGLGGNPLPNNFDGPRDPGVLSAIVELENANPMKDLSGGAWDSVMHAFNEAINIGKASILRFISGTKMTGWLLGSLLRGFFKLFKEFRQYFFVIGSTVVSEFTQLINRLIDFTFGSKEKEDEEGKTASMKQHGDEEQRTLHGEQRQAQNEAEGHKQVDDYLTPKNREELNKLQIEQAYEGDTGKFASPFRRYGQQEDQKPSEEEREQQFDAAYPLRPKKRELYERNRRALVGHRTYIS